MKRRTFLATSAFAMGFALPHTIWPNNAFIRGRDVTYEPDQPLESKGLTIHEGVEILKKGETGNITPVLREEILDNPNAVFIIKAGINNERDENGNWKQCHDQMERLGNRVINLVFQKGSVPGGWTYINPNMVGGQFTRDSTYHNGNIVHPHFTVGMVDALRDLSNANIAIGARGAMRHKHFVDGGFIDLFNTHNLPLIEAHVQYFKDYNPSDLIWHENPNAIIQQRFSTYKPVYLNGTTFINVAHAHVHKVGFTTLTLKNIQGIMPRGYGHTCDAWTTLDIWRKDLMHDMNPEYRIAIEESYVRHGNMGYKYWDEGDCYKSYSDQGGYKTFLKAYKTYKKSRGEERKKALENLCTVADTRLFWAEMWAQRMMDTIEAIPAPYVNIVEGVFGRGDDCGIIHTDFVTVGRSMVTVDAVTTWLMGHDPREVPYLRIANERGLGSNNIEAIPIYLLSESGVERVKDYRMLKQHKCGINVYYIKDAPIRYF